ncbi:MAG: IS5 family transposase [Candidatus Latescibacteria bacterium]|jgi:putative transposase|nr:IS5 family transposase [Candidatus Latescibacterota bacterium]MBT4140351.1 IS5 family transposase [Candidatus Latescibacterota bacterium]MBT5831615.1 IS5 family transposase [Candidatus Latescibacterota bacterium]
MNTHEQYPTDLTDKQWQLIHPLLPKPKWRPGGPGRKPCDLRLVINGILYVTKTGCQWRMLPLVFGKWKTVYGYFNTWSKQGIWQSVQGALAQKERQRQGRKPHASAGCVDSQSVKTATQGQTKGYDANKKVNGRKRHLLVDTLGLIICVCVSSADCLDQDGLKRLLVLYFLDGYRRLRKLWVDGGYRGDALKAWVANLKQTHKIDLEVVKRTEPGFAVLPRRWVVERTFAWLFNFRRLSKDYEVRTRNSEAFIHIAMINLLLKRLA